MSGLLATIASEADLTGAFVAEGNLTRMLIVLMVALGLLMGLVFLTQVAKEWSR
jgi:hypothetical protein